MGIKESFYYTDIENFHNVVYALDIALETRFASMLFNDDMSRIICASNQFAIKKWASKNSGLYNFPFMNYWTKNISMKTDRPLWNNIANIEGIFAEEIGQSLRIIPAKVEYENTLWMNRYEDLLYAQLKVMDDDSNETILYPIVEVKEYDIKIPAFLGHNYNFRPTYEEQDWLDQNKIQTISLDNDFDTMFIVSNEDVYVSKTLILETLIYAGQEDLCELITNTPIDEISPAKLFELSLDESDFPEE